MEPENLLRLINAGHLETALKNMPGASDIYLDFLTQNKPIEEIKKEAIKRIETHIKFSKK